MGRRLAVAAPWLRMSRSVAVGGANARLALDSMQRDRCPACGGSGGHMVLIGWGVG